MRTGTFQPMFSGRPGSPTVSLRPILINPSLDFKRVSRRQPVYSVRVSTDYRALGVVDGADIVWFWIGPHHEYDRMLRRV